MFSNDEQAELFHLVSVLSKRVKHLELEMSRLQKKTIFELNTLRSKLAMLDSNFPVSSDSIIHARSYFDLTPEVAHSYYSDPESHFVLLDVSKHPTDFFPETIHIPLEKLDESFEKTVGNKLTPILVISEKGLRSILACNKLVQMNYFNTANISGGYMFWPQDRRAKRGA